MEAQYDKPLQCVVVTSERWSGYTTVDTEDGWEGSSWSGGRLGIDWYHQSHILVTREGHLVSCVDTSQAKVGIIVLTYSQ